MSALADAKKEFGEIAELKPHLAKHINFRKRLGKKATGRIVYSSKTNGLDEPLPDIYLKVPTGGGKTLVACHAIDSIQKHI